MLRSEINDNETLLVMKREPVLQKANFLSYGKDKKQTIREYKLSFYLIFILKIGLDFVEFRKVGKSFIPVESLLEFKVDKKKENFPRLKV